MREKNERTKRAKEAREKQIERFKFAVEAQKKLEEALQKKRHWQKNCTAYDRGDPGRKLSDTELMHLQYRVVKTLGVLNAVIDPENQRVIGLVAGCKQSIDPHMYQWRTLLSWVGEFLRNCLKFKRVMTGTFSSVEAIVKEPDIRHAAKKWIYNHRFPDGKAPMKIADFCEFLNSTLLVEFRSTVAGGKFNYSFARRFLFDLGFRYVCVKQKGYYNDGHERDDIRKYRQNVFLPQMLAFETAMVKYEGENMEIETKPTLKALDKFGGKELVLIVHDECIFHSNDDVNYVWAEDGKNKGFMSPKDESAPFHASHFLSERKGALKISETELTCDNERRKKETETLVAQGLPPLEPLHQREAMVCMKAGKVHYGELLGVTHEGYWTNDQVIAQLKIAIRLFQIQHGDDFRGVWLFDNSTGHCAYKKDALLTTRMNKGPGGGAAIMKDNNTRW